MKKTISTLLLILAFSGVAAGQAEPVQSEGSKIIEAFDFGEIELSIPEVGVDVERIVMDNGIILYLYEDHTLPLFSLYTAIRCGGIFDPIEKNGLSGIVGKVMRTGGTESVSGDSLNMLLEYVGGSLETSIGSEKGSASLSLLSKDIDLGLKLYADLLRHPAFPQDKIDLAREELRNSIRRRNDRPRDVVARYFSNTIYGDHPYGRMLEWETVRSITREDLMDYHRRFFVPNNIMIGIAGDFDRDDIIKKLEQYLGDWKKSDAAFPEYPGLPLEYHPGVYQIKKDINQAYIRIGHLGIRRDNPARYAINLLDYILGAGSFTSRLTSTVRSDEGLAYSVGSSFDTGRRDYSAFYAYCQTKSSTAYKAISLIAEEIKKIRSGGVTETELEEARETTINRFIFTFDSPGKIVQNLMSLEYNGYPLDYYKHYLDYYRSLTAEDIKEAANKYLKPDSLSFIVVGNPDTYENSLDEFGPITNIDLSEPVLD